MSKKPIIFNTQMVQALLDGRKTQTRRVCKVSTGTRNIDNQTCHQVVYPSSNFYGVCADFYDENGFWLGASKPAYQPGDILYVRETWGDYKESSEDGEGYYTLYRADFPKGAKTYKAGDDEFGKEIICDLPKWHPSIHMPKEIARIFQRVTDVRVERLQDITDEDAKAEGANVGVGIAEKMRRSARERFAEIWDKTVPAHAVGNLWVFNPWVWVYTFERITRGGNLYGGDDNG